MAKEINVKHRNVMLELIKNSRTSDKEIARRLGYSQPTVTRIRTKLETQGYILKYCLIPNFKKMGFELASVISFASDKHGEGTARKAVEWTMKNKSVIFASRGEGFEGRTHLVISIHRNYTEYDKFIKEFRETWIKHGLINLTSFLVPLHLVVKELKFDAF
ncbi:MAG: Lrp/AsnC family transcriptional regulator [Candidatus Aenigmarchaeota archaeon]|nr:Lrp/AsnC family transcriptional regulator [Candidatus Aenigmarchaeota archaeon]